MKEVTTMKNYMTELHLIEELLNEQESEEGLELVEEMRLLAALDYIRMSSCSNALKETGSAKEPVDGEKDDTKSEANDALFRRLNYMVEMMGSLKEGQFNLVENQTVLRSEQRRVKKALDKRIPVADKESFLKGLGTGLAAAPVGFTGALGIIVLIMKFADLVHLSAAFLGSLIICVTAGLAILLYGSIRGTKILNFDQAEELDDGYEFADWTDPLDLIPEEVFK